MSHRPTLGLRHVALFIENFEECAHFYTEIIGMKIDWQPDADNLYLTSGNDNFALHRAKPDFVAAKSQKLDHIGFFLESPTDVDAWYAFLIAKNVPVLNEPKNHRDGTRSFYCKDPDGVVVQMIHVPGDKIK